MNLHHYPKKSVEVNGKCPLCDSLDVVCLGTTNEHSNNSSYIISCENCSSIHQSYTESTTIEGCLGNWERLLENFETLRNSNKRTIPQDKFNKFYMSYLQRRGEVDCFVYNKCPTLKAIYLQGNKNWISIANEFPREFMPIVFFEIDNYGTDTITGFLTGSFKIGFADTNFNIWRIDTEGLYKSEAYLMPVSLNAKHKIHDVFLVNHWRRLSQYINPSDAHALVNRLIDHRGNILNSSLFNNYNIGMIFDVLAAEKKLFYYHSRLNLIHYK